MTAALAVLWRLDELTHAGDGPLTIDETNSTSDEFWVEPDDEDALCRRCGYNLRGLPPDGGCPECGLPLSLAMGGSILAECDPDWLARLRRGVRWIFGAVIFQIVAGVVSVAFARTPAATPEEVVDVITKALHAYGAYLLTTPEFGINAPPQPLVSLRSLVRYGAWASLAGALLFAAPPATQNTTNILAVLLGIVGLIAYFGQFVYLRRFANRIPDPILAQNTTVVMWGIGTSVTIVFVGLVVGVFSSAAGGAGIACVGFCAALIAFVVFGIWYLVLLDQYRRAFTFAEQESIDRSGQVLASVESPPPTGFDRFT